MVALLIFTAVVAAVLAGAVVLLRRRLQHLEADRTVDVVTRGRGTVTREVDAIVVEITNHADVATSRTMLARPLAAVTPGLIRSIVNKETLRIMREQLVEQGVAADVRIRRLRVPVPAADAEAPASDLLDEWLHNDGDNPYD